MEKWIEPELAGLISRPRLSSVQGRLRQVAARHKYEISHHITGKNIECIVPERLHGEAQAALQRRVLLSGMVHCSKTGEQVRVEVEQITVMPEDHELPSLDELQGSMPDLTGGLSTEEFLRMMRNEGYDDYPEPVDG